MSTLAPISVALKFGFLAVLYLFLLWVTRSAFRDLRGSAPTEAHGRAIPMDATGLHSASANHHYDLSQHAPRLTVERAPGHEAGMIYDLDGEIILGRGEEAEIRLQDPFASSKHARVYPQAGIIAIEDLGSTNGTYLNEELLQSTRPLHPGDRVRIGDSEFTFEVD
jgi:FHA domain